MNSTLRNNLAGLPGLIEVPVIGIIRGLPAAVAPEAARAAFAAGLRCIEVTMDSDDALTVVADLRRHHQGVGVGSVVRADQAERARDAGAEFVVSPIVDLEVIRVALEGGMAVFPGAATPTEIDVALRSGATAVKVFPAEQLGGPGYVKAIMSPLGTPPLVPTGGVTPENAADYLRAGAVAVGAGGSLFSAASIAEDGIGSVSRRAAQWVRAVS